MTGLYDTEFQKIGNHIQENYQDKYKLLLEYLNKYKQTFNSEELDYIIAGCTAVAVNKYNLSPNELKQGSIEILEQIGARSQIEKAIIDSDFELPNNYNDRVKYAKDVATHILACLCGIAEISSRKPLQS